MTEESDWELVSDSEPSDWSAKQVHVELPTAGVLPNQTTSESPNISSNSTNSFSVIDGMDPLALHSDTGSSISSFFQLSSNESLMGSSICDQFDLVSLSSGDVCFRCKRCQARNPIGTGICNICHLAQVANPCIGLDEQLALAQQQREEKIALQALQFEERQLQNLMNDSLSDKAAYLAQKLMTQLEPHNSILKDYAKFDFVNRSFAFLGKAYGLLQRRSILRANLNLVCGYVMTNQAQGTYLRIHGFRSDMKVPVYRTMANALEDFDVNPSIHRHFPPSSLSPISENDVMQRPLVSIWIVAAVGSKISLGGQTKSINVPGDTIFPLACLDAISMDAKADEIDSLTKVLFQVIDDTFVDGLHMKVKSIATGSTQDPEALHQRTTKPIATSITIAHARRQMMKPIASSATIAPGREQTTADTSSCFQAGSRGKKYDIDERWRSQRGYPPNVPKRSNPQTMRVHSNSERTSGTIRRIDQNAIDKYRRSRYGTLSFFCSGVSMKDLAGLDHDTRTSLRFYNFPVSRSPEWLLHEFACHGFPKARFNLLFLPVILEGQRCGPLFLDFVNYRDIPEFCFLFCSTKNKSGYQFQRPQYTKHQGKAALTAYFQTTPLLNEFES
ncbi:unnamed protein product [Cylindrotheca closterium]|uniref:Uncharacterized protein n=1 Tax=Cylindrotheca closterium TaxID=2856 RepID=A0AAD2GCV6_9STRA|nr:unnamed protein product [Cylindrotheca closterium]